MDPKSPPPQPSDTLQGSQPMNMSAAAMQNLMANHPRASAFNRLSHPLPFMDLGGQPQAHAHQMMQHLLAQAGPPGYPPGFGLVGFPPPPGPLPPELTASIHSQRSNSNRQDGRAGTHSYASRHQQAEARRRSRINERLDALRKIVPHTERANTALFLEDVVKYVQRLQTRVAELENKLGLPPTVRPVATPILFNDTTGIGGDGVTDVTVDVATASPRQTGPEKRMMETTRSRSGEIKQVPPSSALPTLGTATGPVPTQVMPANPAPLPSGEQQNRATDNAILPSISEELAMAAQLAPSKDYLAEATMAESQPAAESPREADQNTAGRRKRTAAAKGDPLDSSGVELSNGRKKKQSSLT